MNVYRVIRGCSKWLVGRYSWKTFIAAFLIGWNLWLVGTLLHSSSQGHEQDSSPQNDYLNLINDNENFPKMADIPYFKEEKQSWDKAGVVIHFENFGKQSYHEDSKGNGVMLNQQEEGQPNNQFGRDEEERVHKEFHVDVPYTAKLENINWQVIEENGLNVTKTKEVVNLVFQVHSKKSFDYARRMMKSVLLSTSVSIKFVIFSNYSAEVVGKEFMKLSPKLRSKSELIYHPLYCTEMLKEFKHFKVYATSFTMASLKSYNCLFYTLLKHSQVKEAIIIAEEAVFFDNIAKLWGAVIEMRKHDVIAGFPFSYKQGFAYSVENHGIGVFIANVQKMKKKDILNQFLTFPDLALDDNFSILRNFFKLHPEIVFPIPCVWRFGGYLDSCYSINQQDCESVRADGIKMYLGCNSDEPKEEKDSRPICHAFEKFDSEYDTAGTFWQAAITKFVDKRYNSNCASSGNSQQMLKHLQRLRNASG